MTAKEKIDKIKADYEANPILENFEKLCKENSDDSTATNGGLIEGIYKGQPGLKIEAPLYAHNQDGSYSNEVRKMFGEKIDE